MQYWKIQIKMDWCRRQMACQLRFIVAGDQFATRPAVVCCHARALTFFRKLWACRTSRTTGQDISCRAGVKPKAREQRHQKADQGLPSYRCELILHQWNYSRADDRSSARRYDARVDASQALLESWRRQCKCLNALASIVREDNKQLKPSDDGMPLIEQLSHVAEVRAYWFDQANGGPYEGYQPLFEQLSATEWKMSDDLFAIRNQLSLSEEAILRWTELKMKEGAQPTGPYDHPVLFLQHMVWHEGYHAALIMLALRLAGLEPPEEWEEPNIWGNWRNYG